MDIKECYQAFGGDFDNVLERLGSEGFIKRMLLRFPDDKSYQMIVDGIESGDAELAFRGAHTLKGVCANLDFTKLCEYSSELTECLRGRTLKGYEEALSDVTRQYQITIDAIKELA